MGRHPSALLVRTLPGRRTVSAAVWLVHGSAHDPESLAGATHLVEHLTLRRCGAFDRASLARLVDRLGGDVDAWTAAEAMCLSIETTRDALADALALLVDAVLTPTFDRDDVELERRVTLAELELMRDDPADQVEEAVLHAAWGRHPLARPVIGTARSLRRLTPAALRRHHTDLVRSGGMLAAVAGDVDQDDVAAGLSRLPLTEPPAARPLPSLSWHGDHLAIHREGSDQVHARLVFPAVAAGDPRLPALTVLNRMLGVGASSRLFQRLREEEGLTYDIWSGLVLRSLGGLVEVGWASAPSVFPDVLRVVREEVLKLTADLSEDEVEVAREGLVRGLIMDAEDPSGLAGLEAGEVLDRGRRFDLERSLAEVRSVTRDEVAALARELLSLERMASAVCGPKGVATRVA
jgi:predicted Zn-dependent peptidase